MIEGTRSRGRSRTKYISQIMKDAGESLNTGGSKIWQMTWGNTERTFVVIKFVKNRSLD